MKKEKLVIGVQHLDIFQRLTGDEAKELLLAILAYAKDKTVSELDSNLTRFLFADFIKEIDMREREYEEKCRRLRANASKGGKQKVANASNCYQMLPNATEDLAIAKKSASPPNSKIIIKEELFNRGNIIQDDNISPIGDNYPPLKKEEKKEDIIDISQRKDEIGAEETGKKTSKESVDFTALLAYFNSRVQHCAIKPISQMTARRKDAVRARAREFGKEAIQKVIDNAASSEFLNGRNNRNWVADFNWLFLPNNFPKVLEGNYENKEAYGKENLNISSRQYNEREQRLSVHAAAVQRMLDEASRDPEALVNRLGCPSDVQRFPDDNDNAER